jgi:hypothetical protein
MFCDSKIYKGVSRGDIEDDELLTLLFEEKERWM